MNEFLRTRLRALRSTLEDNPNGMVIGNLSAGSPDVAVDTRLTPDYLEFLHECDGGSLGIIDLVGSSDVDRAQSRVRYMPDPDDWLCIGQLLYEPLMIRRSTGQLHLISNAPDTEEPEGEVLGEFDDFLDQAMGPGYETIVQGDEKDTWLHLLRSLGYA